MVAAAGRTAEAEKKVGGRLLENKKSTIDNDVHVNELLHLKPCKLNKFKKNPQANNKNGTK